MCTVTVLRGGDLLRVMCNRDERRQRPGAHPPFITIAGGQRVIAPQDPVGPGTWIAANSAGVVLAILNESRAADGQPLQNHRDALRSRGLVIPALVDAVSLEDVAFRMEDIAPAAFAPFRLIVADHVEVAEFTVRAGQWQARMHRTNQPLLFTSSSLGDALVDGPRRLLFEQVLSTQGLTADDSAARQDGFHAHRWRDRPAVSVHMSRPDACTVSTTTVEVTSRHVRMLYAAAHCLAGTPVGLAIDRDHAGNAAPRGTRRQHAAV
jgi:hypothetical protein